jgi:peroxiredoxin
MVDDGTPRPEKHDRRTHLFGWARASLSFLGSSRVVSTLAAVSAVLPARAQAAKESVSRAYGLRGPLNLDGATTSLAAEANGRNLVVVVMKGHWCGVCVEQLRRFANFGLELKRLDATVIGLNADTVRANRKVAEEKAVNLPILSDPPHAVIDALGLWLPDYGHPMPSLVVFDKCGYEVARKVGRQAGSKSEAAILTLLRRMQEKPPSCDPPAA